MSKGLSRITDRPLELLKEAFTVSVDAAVLPVHDSFRGPFAHSPFRMQGDHNHDTK